MNPETTIESSVAGEASATTAPPRRPALVIALHWLTLAGLLAGVVLILVREAFDDRAPRYALLEAHRYAGLLVLALVLARLLVRLLVHRLPALDSAPRLARAMAALVHVLLYLLLAAVPLLGWAMSNAHGQDVHFSGIALPSLAAPDDDLADTLQQWHGVAAWSLLALGGVHGLAALWHHFVKRDAVLAAMLPWARQSRQSPSITINHHQSPSISIHNQ